MTYNEIKAAEITATSYINQSCAAVCELPNLEDFDLAHFKLDWSKRRRSSRGGWYPKQGGSGISIAMHLTAKPITEVTRVYEYKSFDSSSTIGGFLTKNRDHKIAMHCLHEVAHAAQYWGYYLKKIDPGQPHGSVWRGIYKHLRTSILNPLLPAQEQLKQEYQDIIASIESPLQRAILNAAYLDGRF